MIHNFSPIAFEHFQTINDSEYSEDFGEIRDIEEKQDENEKEPEEYHTEDDLSQVPLLLVESDDEYASEIVKDLGSMGWLK